MTPEELRFWRGKLSATDLPPALSLREITAGLDALWFQSIRDLPSGRVVEYGAQLILDERSVLRLSRIVRGHAFGVPIDLTIATGQTLVGTVHTHPHETGLQGVAFSAYDFYFALIRPLTAHLLHSGRAVFALVQTERTAKEARWEQLEGEFLGAFALALATNQSKLEATFTANLALARRYEFAFYHGNPQQLTRLL